MLQNNQRQQLAREQHIASAPQPQPPAFDMIKLAGRPAGKESSLYSSSPVGTQQAGKAQTSCPDRSNSSGELGADRINCRVH